MGRKEKTVAFWLALLLAVLCLLSACGKVEVEKSEPVSETVSEGPDSDRPLPQMAKKFVTDSPAEGDLLLVQNGVAAAKIVIPKEATDKEVAAAYDLQNYVNRMTNVLLEIITDDADLSEGNFILIGATKQTLSLGEGNYPAYPEGEGFALRRAGNYLILCGNDTGSFRGTFNAVTRFLEEAGCGWFTNDPLWQVVPTLSSLAVGQVDMDQSPRFESRSMSGISYNLGLRWYLGGQQNTIGHGMSWLVGSGYYDLHPEWYALVGDSRDPGRFEYWQFCYTDPDLAAFVAQKVMNNFDGNPNLTSYTVAANDGWDEGWCECERCRAAGNQTDQLLVLANNVAAITSLKYPDRTISILAYHSTFLPPLKTKAHKNTEVMFCLETSPMADLAKGELIHECIHGLTKNVYTQSWKDSVQQYMDDTGLQTRSIWGWYCIATGRGEWGRVPFVQGNVITRNLDLFEEMGIKTVFYDCNGELADLRWPLFYALGVGMWDDSRDGETLLYDACQKLYGAAAEEMFLYYRHLADAAEYGEQFYGMTWVPPYVLDIYSVNEQEIDEAILAAKDKLDLLTEEERQRVETQLKYWLYAKVNL
ncbi:MAG: DUF4838 domain-containing protein [Oscillospiraceae bacterium]|nr:DUF4838 domain-containing protein [Oscillospiraceae bacterium]